MDFLLQNLYKVCFIDKNIIGDFMRKYTIFALICLFTLLLLLAFYYNNKEKDSQHIPQEPISQTYTLIFENGTVNLYKNNQLLKRYENISFDSLPLTDRDNLSSGINLKTMEDVMQIIEDFDGNY